MFAIGHNSPGIMIVGLKISRARSWAHGSGNLEQISI
jgi:hypothetical protein